MTKSPILELLEKALPRPVNSKNRCRDDMSGECPICNRNVETSASGLKKYCPWCGQRLDWDEEFTKEEIELLNCIKSERGRERVKSILSARKDKDTGSKE